MSDETRCSVVRDLPPGHIDAVTGDEAKTQAMLKRLKRSGRLRRVWIWCAALALLLAVAVCLLPLPRHVRRTYQAVEWRCGSGTEAAVPRAVSIEGYYMDYLFRTDRFEGDIRVEGYPITEQQTAPAVFDYGGKGALLSYGYDQTGALYHFGMLLMDPDGGSLAILMYENGGWDGGSGAVISGPANSRDEAAAAAQRLALRYSPAFLGRSEWESGRGD